MIIKLKIWLLVLLFFNSIYSTEVWINVFVHGIIKTPFTFIDMSKIVHDNIGCSQHRHMADYLRNRSEVYLYQPMQKKGLQRIDPKNKQSCNGAVAIAQLYEYQTNSLTCQRLYQHDSSKSNIYNLYYTFGWCGYLSKKYRELEAEKLYYSLMHEVNILKSKNINPKIRIVTFSHGGNVILNMAKYAPCKEKDLPFKINELIFLAIPIHKETDQHINHPIFQKIYNFYSEADKAQTLDFLSTKYMYSHRKFTRRNLTNPDKLTQVKIRVTNITFDNYCNIQKNFHIDPTHMEFWNFSWSPKRYRGKFPLKPFSIASLMPSILNTIKSVDDNLFNITLDIIPNLEKIRIINHNLKPSIRNKEREYCLPFIEKEDLNQMRQIALSNKLTTKMCDYRKIVKNAMLHAYNRY